MTETKRIISLVPSLTHTVCSFGFMDQIVGCTTFCIEPPQLRRLCPSIGGTKNPDMEAIAALKPTHILTNDEENTPPHIAACESIAPTFKCLPRSPGDVPELLVRMGQFLGLASDKCGSVELSEELAKLASKPKTKKTFLYLIWRNPWMAAGPDTYISRALALLGWTNALNESLGRYPVVGPEILTSIRADLVLMSSEPFPFRRRDAEALLREWPLCPRIIWCDGQLMSWFGSMTVALVQTLSHKDRELDGKLFKPLG